MKGKLPSFAICLLLISALLATNHALFQNSEENIAVGNQEVTDKEINKPDTRNTRSPPGWMDEMRLTFSSGHSNKPDMAVWGSNVHVVWIDFIDGNYEIYYKKSTDNGLNWDSDTRLTFTTEDQERPKIAVYQNNIHVVWEYSDGGYHGITYYIHSTDNGDTWSPIRAWDWSSYSPPCYPPPSGDGIIRPDVAVSSNYVYIVAVVYGEPMDIVFKRSSDNGNSWTDWILVKEIAAGNYPMLSINTDGNLLNIVYLCKTGSGSRLDHYYSEDQGETWIDDVANPIVLVLYLEKILLSFATSMQGNNFRVVYSLEEEGRYPPIIIYTKYWDPYNNRWFGPFEVGSCRGAWGNTDVDNDYIVWNGYDEDNKYQLYSNKHSKITDHQSHSSQPSIGCLGNLIHIVWVDNRDGNDELYYTQTGLFADLVLSNTDIHFEPPSPVINGTLMTIDAKVYSYGKSSTNVEVIFYNSDPDIDNDLIPDPTALEIGNDTININKDASAIASIQWTPLSEGIYDIYIWADPNNITQEYNYTNNLANKTLEVIPGIFSTNLIEGWNLISIPLELSDNNLTSVLESIKEQYDAVRYYNASDTEDPWKCYHKSKPTHMNDLDSIDSSYGFWVRVTDPGGTTLTIIDKKLISSHQINLYNGWNLVGYPSNTKYNRTDGLNNLDFGADISVIFWYNTSAGTWVSMGENDYFEPGLGYWFYSEEMTSWDVPL